MSPNPLVGAPQTILATGFRDPSPSTCSGMLQASHGSTLRVRQLTRSRKHSQNQVIGSVILPILPPQLPLQPLSDSLLNRQVPILGVFIQFEPLQPPRPVPVVRVPLVLIDGGGSYEGESQCKWIVEQALDNYVSLDSRCKMFRCQLERSVRVRHLAAGDCEVIIDAPIHVVDRAANNDLEEMLSDVPAERTRCLSGEIKGGKRWFPLAVPE